MSAEIDAGLGFAGKPLVGRCDEDCPFGGEDAALAEHPVIGSCDLCGNDAHTTLQNRKLCFPCAYSEAHW
jgi:hypothetical protein